MLAAVLALLLQISETVEVHVLEVEVSVVDKAGKPVEGLKREDFEVKVDGKAEPVTNFYMVRRGVVVEEPSSQEAATPVPAPAAQIVPTRLVLFVDDTHLHQRTKKRAVEMLRGFVDKTMDDATTAMLVRWNGSLNVLVPGTKDRAALLAALDKISTEPGKARSIDSERRHLIEMRQSVEPDVWYQMLRTYAESQRRMTMQTIAALSETARATSGLEGRKILLYVSEGLPLLAGWEMLAMAVEGTPPDVLAFDLSPSFRELVAYAQNAGVIFCTVDPSGPDGATFAVDLPNGNPNASLIRENHYNTATMMARETGGQLIMDTNKLDLALERLTDQLTTFYSLGVRAPDGKRGPFKVSVHVRNRPELRVITAEKRSVQSRDEMVASSVLSHLYVREEANPLAVDLRVTEPRKQRERCIVDVGIIVNASNLTLIPVDDARRGEIGFHFALLDEKQLESAVKSKVTEVSSRLGDTITDSITLRLKPRKYVLSAAVTDNVSGEVSFLQREIDATSCH